MAHSLDDDRWLAEGGGFLRAATFARGLGVSGGAFAGVKVSLPKGSALSFPGMYEMRFVSYDLRVCARVDLAGESSVFFFISRCFLFFSCSFFSACCSLPFSVSFLLRFGGPGLLLAVLGFGLSLAVLGFAGFRLGGMAKSETAKA